MFDQGKNKYALGLITLLAGIGLYFGWRLMWFLTDDAYIAFRYVSNSVLGHGYVWNAPPFLPVEGYTSFLWIVILDGAWRAFGIEPPVAANWISFFFALMTLILATVMAWRLDWPDQWRRARIWIITLLQVGMITNRSFLTWASSGLETALFNFLVLLWLFFTFQARDRRWWAYAVSGTAVLIALTRPDGLLFCAVTVVLVVVAGMGDRPVRRGRMLLGLSPLLLVAAHLVWRRVFYGAWLPNTYYAKMAGPWPASGIRYLASFVLEHALWIWAVVLVWGGIKWWRTSKTNMGSLGTPDRLVTLGAVGAVLAHLGYYTFVVGGDHFEYRVYSHLTAPLLLTFAWALKTVRFRLPAAAALLVGFIVLSGVIPWVHFDATRHLSTRKQTHQMRVPVAARFPAPFRPYVGAFDDLQDWLIGHYVCSRHQEHRIANEVWMKKTLPARSEGLQLDDAGYPVMAFWGGIGGLAWVLPNVNFIDLFGLNDYVVARSPLKEQATRRMAHDRRPPPEYVNCFAPNVNLDPGKGVSIQVRPVPLTESDIRKCEADWRR
ncbi:MAG: hypothetical protein ABFS42_13955 [Candidatus Krumholzibacteriota bacterium]